MNCPNCNGINVMEGYPMSNYGLTFTVKGTENKFFPEAYQVECKACKDCGQMFDFRIIQKKKKRKD